MSSSAIIATEAVFTLVSAGSIVLRFQARKLSSERLAADDWLMVIAWFFATALAITNIIGVALGHIGMPYDSMTDDDTIAYLKFNFTYQFFYIFAVAFVKLSVLYFYRRVFTIGKTPITIWTLVALTIGWLISFFFATLFQAWPIWCNWIVCPNSMNYPVMYVLSSVTDILLDISILSLPTFFIWPLQMSLSKKVGIIGIFGLGFFCIVASIARLVYTIYFNNANLVNDVASIFDEYANNVLIWSGIEASCSTTCANLACYGPLYFRTRRNSVGERTRYKPSVFSRLCGFSKNKDSSGRSEVSNEPRSDKSVPLGRNVSVEEVASVEFSNMGGVANPRSFLREDSREWDRDDHL